MTYLDARDGDGDGGLWATPAGLVLLLMSPPAGASDVRYAGAVAHAGTAGGRVGGNSGLVTGPRSHAPARDDNEDSNEDGVPRPRRPGLPAAAGLLCDNDGPPRETSLVLTSARLGESSAELSDGGSSGSGDSES